MADKKEKKPSVFVKFFRELKAEFKKITWPSGKTIRNNTLIVLVAVLIVGLIVAAFDLGLTSGVSALVDWLN